MIGIRGETVADRAAITALIRAAFADAEHGGHTEQFIIEELRRAGALTLSLVAEREGAVVGHVAFSPVAISECRLSTEDSMPVSPRGTGGNWYGLGPLSVLPALQRRGIGTALVDEGLARLKALGARGCVVLGEPRYYQRFGFKHERRLVLEGVLPEYFMFFSFGAASAVGTVAYHPAFSARE